VTITRWFGPSWGAGINEDCDEIATPIGEICARCERVIVDGDQGISIPHVTDEPSQPDEYRPWHLLCFLDSLGIADHD
jgi:hypothetical protein